MTDANKGRNALHQVILEDTAAQGDAVRAAIRRFPELIDQEDDDGLCPLAYAIAMKNDAAITAFLQEAPEKVLSLRFPTDVPLPKEKRIHLVHLAARCGDIGLLQQLFGAGEDLNRADALGTTPLHHAILKKQADAVKFLLAQGVDVAKKQDVKNPGALDTALHVSSITILKILLDHGANPNGETDFPGSPLHTAVAMGNKEAARILIRAGASPDIRHKRTGFTLLHTAASNGEDMVKFVLALRPGLNIHTRDLAGNTPLHIACEVYNYISPEYRAAREGAIRELLRAGASLDTKNNSGKTPKAMLRHTRLWKDPGMGI